LIPKPSTVNSESQIYDSKAPEPSLLDVPRVCEIAGAPPYSTGRVVNYHKNGTTLVNSLVGVPCTNTVE